ncbi:BRD4-interacting chromatin-remodeling complex-associated protein-like isoform X2 [Callorhinchus milii]|uniref:BICRA like chromatin remodeling complex associated protein n=2 Tax=Callorhinchus milii TaxID=7868 RepID=A0A4W3H6Q7_CALMI|nr:BRD4-interacting chromatin-remodeling complex-associated protein-like isoform X2 [Callorhinchus milii]|eukprot:gi/632950308/ref/XP_007890644.1/ PREDICTED: GLTSCR1-like protein isoform X2 [Callorhinchus milii]
MDDDDDRDLRDVIGDVQALNDFLHGPGSEALDEDELLGSACTTANSNSLFADLTSTDPASTKDACNHVGEESNPRLHLSSNLNVLEELDASSPLSNLNGDQPFDILQKSLQEANITQQTLQEEADLAASYTSTQDFSQAQLHSTVSTSFSQLPSCTSAVTGLAQQMNVTPSILQQVVRAPFVNNEVSVQPSFFQQMGINSVAIHHIPSSNQAGGIGPIQLIGSLDTQQSVMTVNHLEGSQFISKASGQPSALNSVSVGGYNMSSLSHQQQMSLNTASINESGGLLLQRRVTPLNGNTFHGASNIGQVTQPLSVHFSGNNIQTALPLHNIIIQRGPAPNLPKIPLNIQPKPISMNQQQTVYNVNNLELQTAIKLQNDGALQQQQQQMQQGLPFMSTNSSQGSSVGPPMSVNIVKQQGSRKSGRPQVLNQTGSSIIIRPPMGQHQPLVSQNQFFIPTSLALNMNSTVQHLQTLQTTANGQILQTRTVPTQLVSSHVTSEHILTNRNSAGMMVATQPFSGQFLSNQNSAGQLTSGQSEQTINAQGGQLLINHGTSQLVAGQVPFQQASQTLFNVAPTPGSNINAELFKQSGQSLVPGRSLQNQVTVLNTPSSMGSKYVSALQPVISGVSSGNHVTQTTANSNIVMVRQGEQSLVSVQSAQQPQGQSQLGMNHIYRLSNPYHQSTSVVQPSRQMVFSRTEMPVTQTCNQQQFLYSQFDGHIGGQKRPASKQLTKESLIHQHLQEEQKNVLQPDSKTPFNSLEDAMRRLLPYHVFQGSRPSQMEFQKVDSEFEALSTQLLKHTEVMLSKYRRLLLDDAMRVNPSAEMVMIDRVFNQDEKASLIQDKRLSAEDSDGYLANFCCSSALCVKSTVETATIVTDLSPSSGSIQSTSANTVLSQTSVSSRLSHTTSSAGSGIKTATSSPRHSPYFAKSYSSSSHSKGLKLTIKQGTVCGIPTQNKSLKSQEQSAIKTQGGKITAVRKSGHVDAQSTKGTFATEPAVRIVQVCIGEENRTDVEKKCNNPCNEVTAGGLIKEVKKLVFNQTGNSIELEHVQGGSDLLWHDRSQGDAKNSQLEDFTSVQTKDGKEVQHDTSLHEHLECAINSILDLQQVQKPPDNAVIRNSSPDLEIPQCSPVAPVENYLEKPIPDHNEGIRETDSVLEAAVNSILEC